MIVELFGLPASGKSTFGDLLIKQGFEKITISHKVELVYLNIIFLFLHPVSFFSQLFFLVDGGKNFRVCKFNFVNAFLNRNAKWQKALLHKGDKKFIDEGQFQNILSFFSNPIDARKVHAICKYVLKPDLIYLVTTNESTRVARLNRRGYKGRGVLGFAHIELWERAVLLNHKLVSEEIKALGVPFEEVYSI